MKLNLKEILLKSSIYKFFIYLPFLFFMTFLFFKNFVRSIEFTLTMFFTTYILMVSYQYVYISKYKFYIIGFWFLFFIISLILLKIYSN